MRVLVFLNGLGQGGTEKAACRWAIGLKERGHSVSVMSLADGSRRLSLLKAGICTEVTGESLPQIRDCLRERGPQVIHAHVPGYPHPGDILGRALATLPKIPVVQTNIFGLLQNPAEESWTDFRLFISWTSCVQALRRSSRELSRGFFIKASVAVYPLDPVEGPTRAQAAEHRKALGVRNDEVLFGRFSRPEPNKWTDLSIQAFRRALRSNKRIKLLLREPPTEVADDIRRGPDREQFVVLPMTCEASELQLSIAATDVVLHTSSIGESFGYGIAEPMNLGKPVITHSTPWADEAQLELVRHKECGMVASTPALMSAAILDLASDGDKRIEYGAAAKRHIGTLAHPKESLDRLENALIAATSGKSSSLADEDLVRAKEAAEYLMREQFGHTWSEQIALRSFPWFWRMARLYETIKRRSPFRKATR